MYNLNKRLAAPKKLMTLIYVNTWRDVFRTHSNF